ncbi:hypothetical protein GCM10011498_17560 [Amylibacter cionae]|uniref:Uncharacterized protein n=1 Tax=Neptunicoccus cionae TaxID=2035344 RepID=A0A916QWV3_9RHOB|nr:hypothetical protein GCM10011498_17560 [Amylibacter cionae]
MFRPSHSPVGDISVNFAGTIPNKAALELQWVTRWRTAREGEVNMHNVFYIIGVVVVVLAVISLAF